MDKIMNHLISGFCFAIAFSGLVACGDLEAIKSNGANNNEIKVSGNSNTCGNISDDNFVDYVNHAGPIIQLNNNHYTNQNDDGAYNFLSYLSGDINCFMGPLQPIQYEFSLNISSVDAGSSPVLVLDMIVPDLDKRYHLTSVRGTTTYNDYQDGWTEDTIVAEYQFERGITVSIEMAKSYFGKWNGEIAITYETDNSTNFFIVGSFSESDATLRN